MKTLLCALNLIIATQSFCQTRCMQFLVDIVNWDTHDSTINNTTVHRHDLERLSYTVSYYNCGAASFVYNPRPEVSMDYQWDYNLKEWREHPIFIRLYKKVGNKYEYYHYLAEYTPGAKMDVDEEPLGILLPNHEINLQGTFRYLAYLPNGEYKMNFDYMYEYDIFPNNSPKANDSLTANCFLPIYVPLTSGYYFQTAANTINFKVVE